MDLPKRPCELEVVQDRHAEDHIQRAVGELELMGVHAYERRGIAQGLRVVPPNVELRFGDVDAGQFRGSVSVFIETPLPRLRTDLDDPPTVGLAQRLADELVP